MTKWVAPIIWLALVDTDDGAAVVVGDVHGAEEVEVGDGASSVSLSPSPSS